VERLLLRRSHERWRHSDRIASPSIALQHLQVDRRVTARNGWRQHRLLFSWFCLHCNISIPTTSGLRGLGRIEINNFISTLSLSLSVSRTQSCLQQAALQRYQGQTGILAVMMWSVSGSNRRMDDRQSGGFQNHSFAIPLCAWHRGILLVSVRIHSASSCLNVHVLPPYVTPTL